MSAPISRKTRGTHAKKRRPRGKSLERIAADFRKSAAPLSVKDALELAQIAESHDRNDGSLRRLSLLLLTKSGKELIEIVKGSKSGAQTIAAAYVSVGEYEEKLRGLAEEVISAASARLMVALCYRDDGVELIDEAKKRKDRWGFLGDTEAVKRLRLVVDNTAARP